MATNSIYSCFAVTPSISQERWELFESGTGWPLAGDPAVNQTRVYTNIPRTGGTGLPMGWEAYIRQWRAHTNVPLIDGAIVDWAASTHVRLFFNERTYAEGPLLDLLSAPQAVFDDVHIKEFWQAWFDPKQRDQAGFHPMWIRENIRYGVEVTSPVTEPLRSWLRDRGYARLLCWIHLDGVVMSPWRDPPPEQKA